MATRFALIIEPTASDDARSDFSATFRQVDASAPALSVGELSTQRGDGIFESIGVVDAHPQEVDAHLERFVRSAEICDLPVPNVEQWRQAIDAAAVLCGAGEWVVKTILSRGIEHGPTPTAWVTAADAADFSRPRRDGISVVTLDRGFDLNTPARAPWLLLGAKTLSYAVNMASLREAHRRGADDAVFVSSDGFVLEAPTASVILRRGDVFVTPEPTGGILHGTTQLSAFAWLDEQGYQTAYRDVRADELRGAQAGWLVSSVRLAAPIRRVDEAAMPVDHELTDALNAYLLSPRD
ncbi:MAG: aminotransferase class IV [Microbacterium sp.]|uniref:aminotransferase class IV n=1 Tax=Microbacterium sp. TaxID=51671 RepID=UPI002723EF75|nr:aminotransferase class IV [Microbacterium sp.]MDO8381826.1 aminotransferase class IV [Microbacterium sp.]